MAYNPFDFFRRNQKTLFAVITAFVMIMFVLSFGQGDFFQTIPRWLGKQRSHGDVVATLDGRKVHTSDIDAHKSGRILANQFMAMSNHAAAEGVAKYLSDGIAGAGERARAALGQQLQSRPDYIDRQMLQFMQATGQLTQEGVLEMRERAIRDLDDRYQSIMSEPTASKSDQDLAKAARSLLRLDQVNLAMRGGNYFANLPLTDRGTELFEFDLWLRKADKLGIRYSVTDAQRQYVAEFDNRVSNAAGNEILANFKDRPGFTADGLWTAVADEFRVRAAQAAVLGTGPTRQAFAAPYETFRFFKDQVEPATYAMIVVPAENYLDKVPGTPSDSELRDLFAKHKDAEANPLSEKPGFRKPRELKIAWAEVKGDEPFFTKAAADALTQADVQAKLAFAVAVPPVGLAGFVPLTAPVLATLPDPSLQAAYDEYRRTTGTRMDTAWSWSPFGGGQEFVDNSVVKPANLAAAAGAAAGSALTHGSPFTSLLMLSERSKAEDRNDRARVLVTMLAPTTVAGGNLPGSALAAASRMPTPLPLTVVRGELTDRVKKNLTTRVVENDVRQFLTEANKLAAKKDKAEARAAIEKYVAERGLKAGGSAQPSTVYTVAQDAGLAPLKAKMDRVLSNLRQDLADATGLIFGMQLFEENDASGGGQRRVPAKAMWAPRSFPNGTTGFFLQGEEPEYLFWRTEEVPAVTPKNLDEVRPQVIAAWRRLKARELAKKGAEELQASIKATLAKEPGGAGTQAGVVDRVARDEGTKFAAGFGSAEKVLRAAYFLLSRVAPLREAVATSFPGREQVEGFTVQSSNNIKYPDAAMTTELLKHKDDPFGTTLVLPDAPKDTYYVAVLVRRDERDSRDFCDKMYAQAFPTAMSQTLLGRQRQAENEQAHKQALALLYAEFKVANVSDKLDKPGSSEAE